VIGVLGARRLQQVGNRVAIQNSKKPLDILTNMWVAVVMVIEIIADP
jgi:hypothetical protein